MPNLIAGYRRMTGYSQSEIAEKMNITEGTYRNKEKGRVAFKDHELAIFYKLVKGVKPDVKVEDIFFDFQQTRKDAKKEV